MTAPVTTARSETLITLVEELMGELSVPGVAVGVINKDSETTLAAGVTNIEHPLAVDDHTLFQIGSISKTFTATVIMRLVDEGRLDLEAPVREYLPGFRLSSDELSAGVRLWHLLTHTGGWVGDYFKDFGRGDDAIAQMAASMHKAPQLTQLGSVWSYNNTGFNVAGRVIEMVAGEPFETVVRRVVFEPLGMDESFYFAEDIVNRRVSAGHILTDDGLKVAQPWALPRSSAPAGGVISSLSDMLRYARFHLGDGTAADGSRLLSQQAMKTMQTARAPAGSIADAVGIAWLLNDRGGVATVGHGGSTNGFQCDLMLVPERRFAVVVLANSDHGHELAHTVVDRILEDELQLSPASFDDLSPAESDLSVYAGRYEAALSAIDLAVEDGRLVLRTAILERKHWKPLVKPRTPPPVRLSFYALGRVVGLDSPFKGSRGEFLRDAFDQIEWFRWGGRIARRAT